MDLLDAEYAVVVLTRGSAQMNVRAPFRGGLEAGVVVQRRLLVGGVWTIRAGNRARPTKVVRVWHGHARRGVASPWRGLNPPSDSRLPAALSHTHHAEVQTCVL